MLEYIKQILKNKPAEWLSLTTHRLDIYNEALAKKEFLEQFDALFKENNSKTEALGELPTAYDYIRLGHPLSCVLEWVVANLHKISADHVISFASKTTPILAILRANLLADKNTQIVYTDRLPDSFDVDMLRSVYGYIFEVNKIENTKDLRQFDGSTIYIAKETQLNTIDLSSNIDFYLSSYSSLGSVLIVNGKQNSSYISEVQHVRRRETIAMTPVNCQTVLESLVTQSNVRPTPSDRVKNKETVLTAITNITGSSTKALVGSSGLSVQYAIMMGLIANAQEKHPGKAIKFIVPPNCYGGTNDQARRVAACIEHVAVVDLPVDGTNDMVQSIDSVLYTIAKEDGIPYIIAEIPTNPRVEVPNLKNLQEVLRKTRKTSNEEIAIAPVFILDQTFCPNVHFLGPDDILGTIPTISYASGSKFPSGGQCTAGYCVGNTKTEAMMLDIEKQLHLCDNEATDFQYEILAKQMPSMNQRIQDAYQNTRAFVSFIKKTLPETKINFVSEVLAAQGFTPSVFSLDLPTKGNTEAEREAYKRVLNLKLINMMITKIPTESKYCVSYGQLKGCYWTIPATSTQGTTKEGDKDYIARVSLSPQLDLEFHKQIFAEFAESL